MAKLFQQITLIYETKMWYFTFAANNRLLRKNTTFSLLAFSDFIP